MKEIIETKRGNESFYEYRIIESKKVTYSKKIDYQTVQIDYQNNKYFLLYNSNKEVVRDVFRFVNIEKEKSSFHSKELASTALKILFIFMDILDIDIKDITLENAKMLKKFIYGDSLKFGYYTSELITQRSSDTVNLYIGVYRAFYDYLEIYNSPFHMKTLNNIKVNRYGEKISDKILFNEKSSKSNKRVPMYIKPKEIEKIISVIRSEYTLREEVIVRLMFECGMRIGEVLGLTLEDINTSPEDIYENGEVCGEIIIRNRLCDEPYQYAKGCIIPKYKRSYKSKAYNEQDIGYEKVNPSNNLLMKLNEYVESIYNNFTEKTRMNYCELAKADKVSEGNFLEGDNYYIFINKNGAPLHKSGWNKIIREIFLKSGLVLDKNKRKHNLNHRFRHGYAMFLKKYKGFDRESLMYALRHANPETVSIYFRPDDDDIYIANTEAVLSMYEICPSLKGDNNG